MSFSIASFPGSLTCYNSAPDTDYKKLCAPSEFCVNQNSERSGENQFCMVNEKNLECVHIKGEAGFVDNREKKDLGRKGGSRPGSRVYSRPSPSPPPPPKYVTMECYCRTNMCNSPKTPCVCPPANSNSNPPPAQFSLLVFIIPSVFDVLL